MKQLRSWVPVLGVIALAALFLKLPETPNVLGFMGCKTCSSTDPYLPLFGSAYFAVLLAASLLFPSFPSRQVARGGLVWAVLLAGALSYLNLPGWCLDCLIGHGCNILIWSIWVAVPPPVAMASAATLRERLCLTVFAPISVVALFSCLNLTFMAYGFKIHAPASATTIQAGDVAPSFSVQSIGGRKFADTDALHSDGIVVNFISPDCPYCKEQLPVLNAVATQLAKGSYDFINISPALSPELIQRAPAADWVEDKDGSLRQLFHVSGYPTMFVLGSNGKIKQVISGVSDQLEAQLLTTLVKP